MAMIEVTGLTKRYRDRVAVDALDFTVDERYVVDRDAAQFPKDEAEAQDRWRQRIKYDLLVQKADRLEKEKKAKAKKRRQKRRSVLKREPPDDGRASKQRLPNLGRALE